MKTVSRLITYLAPTHYDLSITIDRPKRALHGTVAIHGLVKNENELRIHAKDLSIESLHVNGASAEWQQAENDELVIMFQGLLDSECVITIGYSAKITDQMHGVYPCYFEHNGVKKELIATQFESHHAREAFPCVDEPEAKATFDVTLTTEQGVEVLGNMPVKSQGAENEQLVTTFDRTPRMSSYLLAWVVGELHKKSATTKGGVEVNVWATPAQPAESLDFALDIVTRTIDFFDEYFGVPYPLPKSDHVALPDFSSGAMENWGLITYRESALLASPKTTSVANKRSIATIITHELSHQWFGNLVTMKWWDNLWLNESFANLMEYIAVDALEPEWNIWLDYAGYEPVLALRRDAIDGVQAVQVDVHHPDEINTLFDGAIVYAKGGRLLRMLQHYIGTKAFQAGLKEYFKKYAYKNTEGDDLWNELSKTSNKDIAGFMRAWISQPGYPVVTVEGDLLSQKQFFIGTHARSNRIWPLPLNASDASLPELFEAENLQVQVPVGTRLNTGDTAHFIAHYSPEHFNAIVQQLKAGSLSPIDRLQLLHEQTLLSRSGTASSADLVSLLQAYANETTESVWDIVALALGELKKFVETDAKAEAKLRTLSADIAHVQYQRLGWDVTTNEPEADTKLRSTILGMTIYGENPEVLQTAKKLYENHKLQDLPADIRDLLMSTMVRHFPTAELIDSLLKTHQSTASVDLKSDITAGLTSTKDPKTVQKLLGLLTDTSAIRTQDTARWFVYLLRNRYARDATWQWMKDNWNWIEATFSGDKSFDDYPRLSATGLVTRQQLEDYKSFFAPMQSLPALSRIISMGVSEIEARVELIERDSVDVCLALNNL
jgi:aminopeptidase N